MALLDRIGEPRGLFAHEVEDRLSMKQIMYYAWRDIEKKPPEVRTKVLQAMEHRRQMEARNKAVK